MSQKQQQMPYIKLHIMSRVMGRMYMDLLFISDWYVGYVRILYNLCAIEGPCLLLKLIS